MMEGMGSLSTDREGRGMPEKSKNRPYSSIFVKSRTRKNAIFP